MKLFIIFTVLLFSFNLNAQDIPSNAWKSGSTWYCNDGYKKQNNQCIKFKVPQNAWVSGSTWYCNDGYKKQNNQCIKFKVPQNAWVSGSTWYCNDGYKKQNNQCIKFKVPQNAWVSGSTWYCNDGYKKQNNQCIEFTVPQNAFAQGGQWYCNEGFKKQGNSCIKLSAKEYEKLKQEIAKRKASTTDGTVAYITKVASDNDDIIVLENDAIVEITAYVGYVGYRKDAVLFGSGSKCNLWIEGKKSYTCSLLKAPKGRGKSAKLVHISEVKGNGSIIKMLDGTIYEVDPIDEINSSLWLGISDAILIDGAQLFNFDEGESVSVYKIN